MGDIHYMISEAAKVVGVEAHVLRYWEEELNLNIGRTEMGHRYYTEDDVQLFHCIRKLKDEGVLLKELKILIPDIQKAKQFKKTNCEEPKAQNVNCISAKNQSNTKVQSSVKSQVGAKDQAGEDTQLQEILEAELKKNNVVLEETICAMVTNSMKKEMSYLLDAKDQLEEDRYRRLDTLIRQQQIQRKEHGRKTVPAMMKHALGLG